MERAEFRNKFADFELRLKVRCTSGAFRESVGCMSNTKCTRDGFSIPWQGDSRVYFAIARTPYSRGA